MNISMSALSAVTYLDVEAVGDRIVNLAAFHDGESWHHWTPGPDNKLIKLQMVDAVHSDYVAKEPARWDDINLPFLEFMWKHASWPDVASRVSALADDVHNLAASLAKVDHFVEQRAVIGSGVTRFAETEVEYVFTVCRSLFDLLQEIVASVWKRIRLLDEDEQKRKRELPRTFSKMVLRGDQVLSAEEMASKYALPSPLTEFYVTHAPFFAAVRDYRNRVIHGLGGGPIFFDTERGFGVSTRTSVFAGLSTWEEGDFDNGNKNVASLRKVLADVVFKTIYSCNAFAAAVAGAIKFPPDIAPGYRFFVRSYHNKALLAAQEVHRGSQGSWWDYDPSVEGKGSGVPERNEAKGGAGKDKKAKGGAGVCTRRSAPARHG